MADNVSFNTSLERLRRETVWDATEGIQEVYAVLKSLITGGIDGPLQVNTQGSNPGIVFKPADINAGGSPFSVSTGGTNFYYTFGGQTAGPTSFDVTGGNVSTGPLTVNGNTYNFYGNNSGATTNPFNPGNFTVNLGNTYWGGAGGPGGGGGTGWTQLAGTSDTAGAGTAVALAQIVSGSGTAYRVSVKGFGSSSFETDATALGLSKDDKLRVGSWHVIVAYITGENTADIFFAPAVYN